MGGSGTGISRQAALEEPVRGVGVCESGPGGEGGRADPLPKEEKASMWRERQLRQRPPPPLLLCSQAEWSGTDAFDWLTDVLSDGPTLLSPRKSGLRREEGPGQEWQSQDKKRTQGGP